MTDEDVRRALKEFLKMSDSVFVGKVTDVDLNSNSCTVQPIEAAELLDVRLKAAVENVNDGIVEVPVVGSSVIVGLIGNDENTAYIIKCSQVDKVIFYGGNNGGIPLAKVLKQEFDKTNEIVKAMMQALQAWTPVAQDGGAALKTVMSAALAGKTAGDYSNIENDKIIQ